MCANIPTAVLMYCLLIVHAGCVALCREWNKFPQGESVSEDIRHSKLYQPFVDPAETNGVIHSRLIVEEPINKSFLARIPSERVLIFDTLDPRKRVLLNDIDKEKLQHCLEGAKFENCIPLSSSVCTVRDFDYALGVGNVCDCENCRPELEKFYVSVGPDWAFVQSELLINFSKDGDSDIKFKSAEKYRLFRDIVRMKIQELQSPDETFETTDEKNSK